MYPLVIALVGAMLLAWNIAITQPTQIAFQNNVAGAAAAVNFWAYRTATESYRYSHPAFSGAIPDVSLSFPVGYVRNLAWTNVVQGGTLYTYSVSPIPPSTIDAIAGRGGRTLMIGVAQVGGTMSSLSGGASGFVLPAVIPNGAVVVIGN